jgi:hypothetical protein
VEVEMKVSQGICSMAAATLAACTSAQSDWQQASSRNTLAAYQAFVEEYPDTQQSIEARNRIQALQDDQAWTRALQTNTVDAFQHYMEDQPSGTHVVEARVHVRAIERMAAGQSGTGSPPRE